MRGCELEQALFLAGSIGSGIGHVQCEEIKRNPKGFLGSHLNDNRGRSVGGVKSCLSKVWPI